jgi:hypothetical protein
LLPTSASSIMRSCSSDQRWVAQAPQAARESPASPEAPARPPRAVLPSREAPRDPAGAGQREVAYRVNGPTRSNRLRLSDRRHGHAGGRERR